SSQRHCVSKLHKSLTKVKLVLDDMSHSNILRTVVAVSTMACVNRILFSLHPLLINPSAVGALHSSTGFGVVRSRTNSTSYFVPALPLAVTKTIALEASQHPYVTF